MRIIERRNLLPVFLLLPTLLLGAAMAVAAPGEDGRLPVRKLSWTDMGGLPGGQAKLDRELTRQRVYHERWHEVHDLLGGRHLSAKSRRWLADKGLGEARLQAPLADVAKAEVRTLRILLIRIAFSTGE